MLGGAIHKKGTSSRPIVVRHTAEVVVKSNGKFDAPKIDNKQYLPAGTLQHPIKLINLGGGENPETKLPSEAAGTRTQINNATMTAENNVVKFTNPQAGITNIDPVPGDHIRIFWEEVLTGEQSDVEDAVEVTISPDTFPGTYRVVGDTFIRSEKTGKDEPFQFVINKAKVQSNVTLTLQAEGDPTTFEMTLNVLRSTNDAGENEMMKLVRYSVGGATASADDDFGSLNPGSGG